MESTSLAEYKYVEIFQECFIVVKSQGYCVLQFSIFTDEGAYFNLLAAEL